MKKLLLAAFLLGGLGIGATVARAENGLAGELGLAKDMINILDKHKEEQELMSPSMLNDVTESVQKNLGQSISSIHEVHAVDNEKLPACPKTAICYVKGGVMVILDLDPSSWIKA